MRRLPLLLGGLAVLVVAAVALVLLSRDSGPPAEQLAADRFAQAWTRGTLAALPWDATSGPDPAAQVAALTERLTPADGDRPTTVEVGTVVREGDRARAPLTVSWDLGGPAPWTYDAELPLVRAGDSWRPVLSPAVVHPQLAQGRVLRSRAVDAPRAPVLGRADAPLVVERPVVVVGLEPRRATDLAATTAQVAQLTGVDGSALLTRAQAARPDAFVEAVVLRRADYDAVRDRLRPVPGVVLREQTRQLAPTSVFARGLLGSVGPATAEVVQRSGGTVRPDQQVGLSGLQARFQAQLAGTPGLTVETVDAQGDPAPVPLLQTPPVPGTPLRLTLDPAVQDAADRALATAPEAASLVAVQAGTGDVLAVADGGPGGSGSGRALNGSYPPGSTFKVASTLALLQQGLRPDDVVPCPATVSVQGKEFANAEQEVLGPVPFRTDFAESCNTAFVGSARRVTPAQLQAAAQALGYGDPDLGVGAVSAQVPVGDDPVEHAAAMIGQGEVLASPLQVAVASATVASGTLHPPRLLADAPAPPPGAALPGDTAQVLRELMREVVTSGTGTALRDVPGAPIGKTGTAEYGTEVPPRTHAWFTGARGDLAYAVVVEDGGFGGAVAAPVAAAFLRALPV